MSSQVYSEFLWTSWWNDSSCMKDVLWILWITLASM